MAHMIDNVKWVNDDELPQRTRNTEVKLEIESWVATLQENPGKWAEAYSGLKTSTANNRSRQLRSFDGIESRTHGGSVFARYHAPVMELPE